MCESKTSAQEPRRAVGSDNGLTAVGGRAKDYVLNIRGSVAANAADSPGEHHPIAA
ncbi:hypothetical protein [Paenibacillus graminis]|uniref:hypothetical protein n=1 Tax=Paenibacillus graminis TaxID=189425 RepID=UPI002DB87A59|nr:hypothetical protein [Paenibacillus graminis]MEC0167076.1 hypothetical protein [Paenibacillus graminis]